MTIEFEAAKKIVKARVKSAASDNRKLDKLLDLYRCRNWGPPPSEIEAQSGDADLVIESGVGFAFIDTMASSVVPTNPAVSCVAKTPSLEKTAYMWEALTNYVFRLINAHDILWRLTCRAGVFPYSALKFVWDLDTRRPKALVLTPKTFWFDTEASRWEDIRYCIEAVPLTKDDVAKKVKAGLYDEEQAKSLNFGEYPEWLANKRTGRVDMDSEVRKQFQWTVVYEFYDLTSVAGGFFVLHPECKLPLMTDRLPYVFLRNPYRLLTFNDNLEDLSGMSDLEIIEGPVRRKDELLTLKLRFAQSTIPVTLVDSSALDDPEAAKEKLAKATGPWDMVDLNVTNGQGLEGAVGSTGTPGFNPSFNEIDQAIDQEIAFRLGMPEYSRGQTGGSDVATAYALVDANLQTRQGRRQIRVNDMIRFMAEAIVGLFEEFLKPDDNLPVRLVGKRKYVNVSRKEMRMRDPAAASKALDRGTRPDPPLDIDFDVAPYSPMESNKANQLRKISQFKEILFGSPLVDQEKLHRKLFDLLEFEDMTAEQQAPGIEPDPSKMPPEMGGPPLQPGAEGVVPDAAPDAAAQGFSPETAFDPAATQGRSVSRDHPVMPAGARGGPGLPGQF